jgi:hypothetical protein
VVTLLFPLFNASASEGASHEPFPREALTRLLPGDSGDPAWKRSSGPEVFDSENLWEYMDGQAQMYLDYGFKLLATAGYKSPKGSGYVTVEIYQMRSPLHAFGIYAAERSPDDHSIGVGEVQGSLGEFSLNFWKGAYYVKTTSSKRSTEEKEMLTELANSVARKIEGDFSEPELFSCFPKKDRVKGSERFIPKNFLGQPYLSNGYRMDYRGEKGSYQVFLAENGSQDEARKSFERYGDFLRSENGEISVGSKNEGYESFSTKEGKVIFLYGRFLGGVLNCHIPAEADVLIHEVVRRLAKRR